MRDIDELKDINNINMVSFIANVLDEPLSTITPLESGFDFVKIVCMDIGHEHDSTAYTPPTVVVGSGIPWSLTRQPIHENPRRPDIIRFIIPSKENVFAVGDVFIMNHEMDGANIKRKVTVMEIHQVENENDTCIF